MLSPDQRVVPVNLKMDSMFASVVESASAPVAQLDRASDFESRSASLPILTKIHKHFRMGCLAGFRAMPPKQFGPQDYSKFGTKLARTGLGLDRIVSHIGLGTAVWSLGGGHTSGDALTRAWWSTSIRDRPALTDRGLRNRLADHRKFSTSIRSLPASST